MTSPTVSPELRPHRLSTHSPHRDPIDLPERFRRSDSADNSEEEDGDDPETAGVPFMHQSVFGVIAATHSKEEYNRILDQQDSGDETQDNVAQHELAQPSSASRAGSSGISARSPLHVRLYDDPSSRQRPLRPDEARPLLSPHVPPGGQRNHALEVEDPLAMSQILPGGSHVEDLRASTATLTTKNASALTASLKSPVKAPAALPETLKDIFKFEELEDVVSEYPCWYLANVLLQGYMYITQRHVCFYAYLQQKNHSTVKSGYLGKRGKNNPRFRRYWFTLKGSILSYYTDPATPYFPRGNIDLRRGVSAELVYEKDKQEPKAFQVTTDERAYRFKADSETSAKEWVRVLQRSIFRSRNDGDSVKISLPIDNIIDVEENPVIDFAETIKIRVVDGNESFAVDEYFFSFFSFGKDALNVLRIMTQDTTASKALAEQQSDAEELHGRSKRSSRSTKSKRRSLPFLGANARATSEIARAARSSSAGRSRQARLFNESPRTSLDRPQSQRANASRSRFVSLLERSRSPAAGTTSQWHESSSEAEGSIDPSVTFESTDISDSDPSGSRILTGSGVFRDPVIATSASRRKHDATDEPDGSASSSRSASQHRLSSDRPGTATLAVDVPKTAAGALAEQGQSSSYTESFGNLMRAGAYPIHRATGMLKDQGRRVSSYLNASPRGYYEKVYGMWAGGKKHYADADGLQGEDYVYDPEEEADTAQAEERFREHFALPSSEKLVATYFAHILRVIPLYGKIYIGTSKLCFRSLLPGTRTKLVIPFKDILNVDKEKGFNFGYSGMVTVIRGYEEIFFEFNTAADRDDCTVTVLKFIETLKMSIETASITDEERATADKAADEHTRLQEARHDGYADHDLELPKHVDDFERGVPTILFDDPEASVLDFKPSEPLAITCLTIGSRGDVQPYIALCKGLLAEGHKPKIATHAEFEPWIRKHGIEFAPVDGDPAELMRICVENGMFTPSFLYEANSKFRGFLDTLLTTAWTACQGSDVLIESPSAMAGIHIAEALGIPYFRAFTMPWTRTRAYPHAFAVPNHKMGGAYNYMTYVLFDNVFWQSTAGQINRWRRKVLGLRATSLDRLQPNKVPFLYNFSPSVVVPPLDFSDWIRVTGYWFLDEATSWTPPADLVSFIARARADKIPLVYIGFGSVVVSDSRALTETIIKAVASADVRCVLSKGWSDRLSRNAEPDIALPPSIHAIASAPHDWLFSQMDAAVHHGGAGTTGASLRAGIPTVIKPFFGDQFFFAARVHDLGVGCPIKRLSTSHLGRALWIATHDARMRHKAAVLGAQIRAEDGVGTAIKALYRDMEYARTLVGRRAGAGKRDSSGEGWTIVGQEGDSEGGEE